MEHLLAGNEQIEKLDPSGLSHTAFQEVLGVDEALAFQLQHFFSQRLSPLEKLGEIEGLTEELIERIHKYFVL